MPEDLSDEDDENPGEEESEDAADDHFARAVSDALLQSGKLAFVDLVFQLVDEHVEIAALVAQDHTDAERVVDDDECEAGRDREDARMESFIVSDRSEKGNGEGRVRARHMSVREDVAPVEAVLDGIEDELDDLREKGDDDRDEKDCR